MSLLTAGQTKPNRLDKDKYPKKETNEKYHLDYARWAVSHGHNSEHHRWVHDIKINKRFYKGDQWFYDEDVEAFLKDDTNQDRNRIQVKHNLIRPMVEQYRGNAIRLSINASAKSISKKAINRREERLGELLLKTDIANEFPAIGRIIRSNDPAIGDDQAETTTIFNNLYVDEYVNTINMLLNYIQELNEFQEMQVHLAQNLALSGLGVVECFEHGGHQRYSVVESDQFIWDRDARKLDLTDAGFMGALDIKDPAVIFERWNEISIDDKKAIETYVSQEGGLHTIHDNTTERDWHAGRVPVYRVYWRDTESHLYGWVLDEDGYEILDRIDFTAPGEEGPKFTMEDVIDPPNTPKNRRLFPGKKKTRRMSYDVLRYCVFIPSEVLSSTKQQGQKRVPDIILEFGTAAYQETQMLDISNVKFPFKCFAWGYVDGEVYSPVDDAINPQRFINRVLSVTESQINNSGGTNVILDEDTLPNQDPDQVYHNIAQGKPITIRTKGRGIPNSIGTYDATPKQGTYKMFEMIPLMAGLIQNTTGVNEGLKGESTGSDQLVGVTELLIQRGSLMQEPFYNALANIFVQMHQYSATVGKKLYIANERELAIAVGDDGVQILKLTEDMRGEDFRVFVKRENSDETLIRQGDQQLLLFRDLQLIDEQTFVDNYGRSTPDQVLTALRRSMGAKIENQRRQEKVAAAQAEEQANAEADFAEEQQRVEGQNFARDRAAERGSQAQGHDEKMEQIALKGVIDNQNQQSNNLNR